MSPTPPSTGVERPTTPPAQRPPMAWGSDVVAELLSRLELPYLSLNPGASYRGLHDSIVNYLGNERPELILCLHEEHAVALAHGYAKVTERPLAVALHSNVGLMHAAMALYNAFCDRVPMLVIGATGPLDAAARRPWIDWIHTSADQGALIRGYVKWDDQPASVAAAAEALVRGEQLTRTYPCAPVYVCLDAALQEAPLEARAAGAPRPRAPPAGAAARGRARAARAGGSDPRERRQAADHGRSRQPRRARVGGARRARRAPRRGRPQRPAGRRRLPERPPPAPGRTRDLPAGGGRRAAARAPTRCSRSTGSISAARSHRPAARPPPRRRSSPSAATSRSTTAGARTTSRSRRSTSR